MNGKHIMSVNDPKRSLRTALLSLTAAGITAAALAAPLPALAQAADPATDEASESQLEMSVEQVMETYGIEAEVGSLSLAQLAEIHSIVSDGSDVKQRIEAVVAQ